VATRYAQCPPPPIEFVAANRGAGSLESFPGETPPWEPGVLVLRHARDSALDSSRYGKAVSKDETGVGSRFFKSNNGQPEFANPKSDFHFRYAAGKFQNSKKTRVKLQLHAVW
jgi:hypothetical protein